MSIMKFLGSMAGGSMAGSYFTGSALGGVAGGMAGGAVYGAAKLSSNRTFQMYAGGGLIGAGAGGLSGMMSSGEIEGGFSGAFKGGLAGMAAGGAVRSLVSKGGFLNTAGQMVGRTFDDAGATRVEKQLQAAITKRDGMAADAEGYADAAKLVTDLEKKQAEGGGMSQFFRNLAETGEERARRQGTEYFNLSKRAKTETLSTTDQNRLARMEREFGDVGDLDPLVMKEGTTRPIRGSTLDGLNLKEGGYNERVVRNSDLDEITVFDDLVMNDDGSAKIAGYAMHKSFAGQSINSRNGAMIMGGAGLTGGMMGLSHSRNRRNKRRGFNSKRGSRF